MFQWEFVVGTTDHLLDLSDWSKPTYAYIAALSLIEMGDTAGAMKVRAPCVL